MCVLTILAQLLKNSKFEKSWEKRALENVRVVAVCKKALTSRSHLIKAGGDIRRKAKSYTGNFEQLKTIA